MQSLWQYATLHARGLVRRPAFIMTAVATMALGSGFAQVKTGTILLDDINAMQLRNV